MGFADINSNIRDFMSGFSASNFTTDTIVANYIAALALEEASFAHLLNAEGETIQTVTELVTTSPTAIADSLIRFNETVAGIISSAAAAESVIKDQMSDAFDAIGGQ